MSGLKTQPTDQDVGTYIASIADDRRRSETAQMVEMMQRLTGEPPVLWGASLIGFGRYRYTNTTGKELGWFLTGVAPRKQALTVYIMPGFEPFQQQLAALGPHKLGRSCLYIRRLDKVDIAVLEEIVDQSVDIMRQRYPAGDGA